MTNETEVYWRIEEDTAHGTSFALHVGPLGTPFHHTVRGLSHEQADDLQTCLLALSEKIQWDTKRSIRAVLGI